MVALRIKSNDTQVTSWLNKLMQGTANPTPVLKLIGNQVANTTKVERFKTETAPDGTPWKPLKPEYRKRKLKLKPRRIDKTLQSTGALRRSIVWQLEGHSVLVGSNLVYAPIHQLGGRTGRAMIPARPYLGLSDGDQKAIVEIVGKYLGQI